MNESARAAGFGGRVKRGISAFFGAIGTFFADFGRAVAKGDAFVKLSLLWWGAGYVRRKQFVKGLIMTLLEVGVILFSVFFASQYVPKFGTLGTVQAEQTFNMQTMQMEWNDYDHSFMILLFSLFSFVVWFVAFVVWIKNTVNVYRLQQAAERGEHINTFVEDVKTYLDEKFHITLLSLPVLGIVIFTVIPILLLVFVAFTNYDQNHMPPNSLFTWVGLDNFASLLGGGGLTVTFGYAFVRVLGWTLVWAFFSTLTTYFGGILLSLLLNSKLTRGSKFWRLLFVITIAVPQFVSLLLVSNMIYDTSTWEYPYLYNLIDQYRALAKYNNGYAYNMMFVGPGWMNKMGRWEAPYELLKKSYEDGCAYYGQLKKEGKLIDMTMSEFADYYREKKGYTEPECALWRDILYGSQKQLFWYCDPYMRACVNMDQGGAIVDLRPYVAKLNWPVGIGTPHIQDASYPFLIQEKYRAGYFTHYAGEGTVRSAKVCHNGEEVDLCLCRTHAHFSQNGKDRVLTLDPVDIEFSDVTVKLQTVITFTEGSSSIKIDRHILEMSDPDAVVTINEYMVGCYGTTEYTEDMSSLTLKVEAGEHSAELPYEYKCREASAPGAARVPPIETLVSLTCEGRDKAGYVKEGYAFSPMFTLGYTGTLRDKEVFTTWLNLEKAN